jgi:hypothetical protein
MVPAHPLPDFQANVTFLYAMARICLAVVRGPGAVDTNLDEY